MELSEQLKYFRVNKNMTQEELAKNLFITRQTISRWETGKVMPPLTAIYDIADLYNISVSELLGDKVIMKNKVNFMAIIGSTIFNILFLSTFGLLLLSFWIAVWVSDVLFIVSPLLVMGGKMLGLSSTGSNSIIFSIIFCFIGIIGVIPLRKLSYFLYQASKRYFRYTFNNDVYTIENGK